MSDYSIYESININTIVEPFRIRSVEPIHFNSLAERAEALAQARRSGAH